MRGLERGRGDRARATARGARSSRRAAESRQRRQGAVLRAELHEPAHVALEGGQRAPGNRAQADSTRARNASSAAPGAPSTRGAPRARIRPRRRRRAGPAPTRLRGKPAASATSDAARSPRGAVREPAQFVGRRQRRQPGTRGGAHARVRVGVREARQLAHALGPQRVGRVRSAEGTRDLGAHDRIGIRAQREDALELLRPALRAHDPRAQAALGDVVGGEAGERALGRGRSSAARRGERPRRASRVERTPLGGRGRARPDVLRGRGERARREHEVREERRPD